MPLETGLELWSEDLRFAMQSKARTAGSAFQEAVLSKWQRITEPDTSIGKQKE